MRKPSINAGIGQNLVVLAFLAISLLAQHLIFGTILLADVRHLGFDFGIHMPSLLSGYFLFHNNGLLEVPWFSPAQCGGLPFLGDPQVGYYALYAYVNHNLIEALALGAAAHVRVEGQWNNDLMTQVVAPTALI